MNRFTLINRNLLASLALVVLASVFGDPCSANGQYEINWHTIDCGGKTSNGGSFSLSGTIGQHDAGPAMQGGGFQVIGGFWDGGSLLPACPEDIIPDGLVNVDDLLAVISAWGACPGCAADITGDGVVNINDLLAIINAWGPC